MATALALAFAQPSVATEAGSLKRQLGPGANVTAEAETGGQVTFIGTEPGQAISLAATSPRAAAIEAADRFAPHFGLGGDSSLHIASVSHLDGGRTAFRFQQTIRGLPVIGGQLAVSLNAARDLLSIGGELVPSKGTDTASPIAEAEASAVALAAVAKEHGKPVAALRASPGELSIYDSRLLGGPGLETPRPVWRFEVTGGEPRTIRQFLLVDARLGNVALSFSEIDSAKFRWVCDSAFTESHYFCLLGDAARAEGEGAAGIGEVDSAYNLSGLVYDFYLAHLGRDSIDGNGAEIVSNVRFCEEGGCPVFENAFWNGAQMTFGPGWVTDDVLGHELTHGVVEHEAGLFYYYQSGAINESFADVFGELFDLSTGSDPVGDRWLMGEEGAAGAFRSMSNPSSFGMPDRTGSPDWYFNPSTSFGIGDAGGVHYNSGVSNKLAYLLTDGDTFNGQTVTGLGIDKVLRIYDEANVSLLTSGSDYADLGQALRQACANLTGTNGMVSADCVQVDNAVLATEMDSSPDEGPADAALCTDPAKSPVSAFFDDLETPQSGNWGTSVATGAGAFFYPQSFYAASGSAHIAGYDWSEISDSTIEMASGVTVPTGGLMHFKHAYGFESGGESSFDGGVLEYSTDGGASWHDASGMIVAGATYTDTLSSSFGNPLGGRQAFAGDSAGYGSTRLDLAPLAGQQVRFRFRLGTDDSIGDYGWFVDDVRIYSCEDAPPSAPATGPDALAPHSASNDACVRAKVSLALARAAVQRARRALRRSRSEAGTGESTARTNRLQQRVRAGNRRVVRAQRAVRHFCY